MLEYRDTMFKLNEILKKNDLSLIDEFDDEITQLIKKVETCDFCIDINRCLIRRTYRLILMMYGEKASLKEFKILINNLNDEGVKILNEFSKKEFADSELQKEKDEIVEWFLDVYYSGLNGVKGAPKTYFYSIETRYFIDKFTFFMNDTDLHKKRR